MFFKAQMPNSFFFFMHVSQLARSYTWVSEEQNWLFNVVCNTFFLSCLVPVFSLLVGKTSISYLLLPCSGDLGESWGGRLLSMKDESWLFSLCKWGHFAFRAWEQGWFYLTSAKQQHMLLIFLLWIFCLDGDAVGEGSDVATETKMSLFLWMFRCTVSW